MRKLRKGPRPAVLSTVERILKAAGFQGALHAVESLVVLAAALKEAGYRSAKGYLFRAKQVHVPAGFEWSV